MTNELSISGRDAGTMTVRLRLDAVAENVMLVRQTVDGAAREFGASQRKIDDIKLAVTEACSNVVKYAYRDGIGELTVGVEPLADGLAIVVSDGGAWLEREDGEREAGGLGIPLMEAVARECDISTDENGTTVYLEFDRDGVPEVPDV
jgi:serine/threonine-protein kinase RsbW